jgi:hypothetical protein
MKPYYCNICERKPGFDTIGKMVAHYRVKHPDDGADLWNVVGTLGDTFADSAMKSLEISHRLATRHDQSATMAKGEAYDQLAAQYEELRRMVTIAHLAIKPIFK